MQILISAFRYGADAVYFGGMNYGARASAANFSDAKILEAIDYAHSRGKKLYLTVNTLLKNLEMERGLYEFIKPIYEAGIDGVIVQDFGVFCFLRQHFPDLVLHASTQMNLCSRYGAAFLKEQGARRIVPARELSLSEIRDIHQNVEIEIEAFVHGALCVSYSGTCLMSSFIGGRSGNRGRCGQPCRLPYELLTPKEPSAHKRSKPKYYLSPKDLCGIDELPRLLDAGVDSLKIEGRLKNESYVATVTSVYRKYVDLLKESPKEFRIDEKDKRLLLDAGNRGSFTNTYYYKRNDKEMMALQSPAFFQKEKGLPDDLPIEENKIQRDDHRRIAPALPFSPCKENEGASGEDRIVVAVADYHQMLPALDWKPATDLVLKDRFLYRADLKKILSNVHKKRQDLRLYLELPVVFRKDAKDPCRQTIGECRNLLDGIYVSSYDGLGFLEDISYPRDRVYFDQRLYAYSNRAVAAFSDAGYMHPFVPLELNEKELSHRYNDSSECLVYGYEPLMYMANCISKNRYGCKKRADDILYLVDRKKTAFMVENQCHSCINVLYNDRPIVLYDRAKELKKMGIRRLRLDFTIEGEKEMGRILKDFEAATLNGGQSRVKDFTRGHYRRGVE